MTYWAGRRVAVTGGSGFIGTSVVAQLRERGCDPFVPRSRDYDLRSDADVRRFFDDAQPEIVLHLAATSGGIGANGARPGAFLYDNLVMGARLIEEARVSGVRKLVCIGTICSYPKVTPVPFRENDLWNGYPDEVSAPYGIAKKTLLVQLQAYRKQYGFRGVFLMPVNVYGPRDNFDPQSSNVVAALVRKFVEAERGAAPAVTCWGSGRATREFLYVADCAEGILLAAERWNEPDPINLGSGVEVSIRELARRIAALTGFRGRVLWDESQPDGQLRRCLDVTRAAERFGFSARTSLDIGLARTIDWFRTHGSARTDR
jgi:GDP-L-fucose synthase